MARRVADLRLALGIISAPPDARDPRWVPAPVEGPPVDGPIRVAVVRDPVGAGIDPQVRAGIDRAADWLADAGYEIVDAEPPQIAEAVTAWFDDLGRRRHDVAGAWSPSQGRTSASSSRPASPRGCSRIGEIATAMRMVVPVNVLGLPSCAVPVGAGEGLPQGVQLIGARFQEHLLLDAAQAIEDRAPALTPIQPRVAATV